MGKSIDSASLLPPERESSFVHFQIGPKTALESLLAIKATTCYQSHHTKLQDERLSLNWGISIYAFYKEGLILYARVLLQLDKVNLKCILLVNTNLYGA
jgi:hypothetical protein